MSTAEIKRPQMGLSGLLRHLRRSEDPLVLQLAANLGEVLSLQQTLQDEAREIGEPASYAAVRVGGVVDLLAAEMTFPVLEIGDLSEPQRKFFEGVQENFPGVQPLELEQDGGVIFHGRGEVLLIDREGTITQMGEKAPNCPHCATNIMRKIDRGYEVAQCDHCGNAVRDVSGGSND